MQTDAPNPDTIVWFQNRFVRLAEANVNILTHALNYGAGVFEGIRGYYEPAAKDMFLVRAAEHYERWKKNCGILRIHVPPAANRLVEITAELCRRNDYRTHVYVRPLAYKSAARVGVAADEQDDFSITVVPYGEYLSDKQGVKAAVVSWRRVQDNAIPGRAKICGAYANSVLALDEARRNGHDEAILLNEDGHVAEGATCNLFMVRDGKLITPPITDNILEGITRASVIELASRHLGLNTVERSIDRSELYLCDEVFFTGTAVEITPVLEVDHRPVGTGAVGAITQKLQSLYVKATRGGMPEHGRWLSPVYSGALLGKTA